MDVIGILGNVRTAGNVKDGVNRNLWVSGSSVDKWSPVVRRANPPVRINIKGNVEIGIS